MPGVVQSRLTQSVIVVSRSVSAFLPTFSAPVLPAPVGSVVVFALQVGAPPKEPSARAANVGSAAGSPAVEAVHFGWTLADCWAGPQVNDSARAVDRAALSAHDSAQAYSARVDSAAPRWASRLVRGLTPADSSAQADRNEPDCSLRARPEYWPAAERPRDSPERYRASRSV